jgi:hypothetical protein
LAAFSTAFDLTALRRLAVLDAAAAADASSFGAVTRDDAFLLFFISAIVSSYSLVLKWPRVDFCDLPTFPDVRSAGFSASSRVRSPTSKQQRAA